MTSAPARAPLPVATSPDLLVGQLRTLPAVPKVILRLQPMLSDINRTTLEELAGVIRLERALAARLLQVCNGTFMGSGEQARSIEEAIHRLGFREVRRLVTVVIGMQILEKPMPAYRMAAREVWRQSIACALAAEELAMRVNEDPAAAYALGLLHSVGMVVVNAWATMAAPGQTLASTGFPDDFTVAERALLGFTNADTGASLLRKWDFPPAVYEPVRAQYQPVLAASHPRLADLLLVARWLRSAVCEGTLPTVLPQERSMDQLGLDEAALLAIVPEVSRKLEETSQTLGGA